MTQRVHSPSRRLPRAWPGLILLGPFLLAILLYASTLTHGWVFDDHGIVEDNPLVSHFSLARILRSSYWSPHKDLGLYRPLTIASLALNRSLLGPQPWTFHLVNVLLHGLNAAALVWVARRLGARQWTALVAGLVFAAHPVHVEAVAPVVGRSELLACLFVLCALAAATAPRHRGLGMIGRPLSGVFLFLGLLSKENAVAGLLVLAAMAALAVLFDRSDASRTRLSPWMQAVFWPLLAVLGWIVLRRWAMGFFFLSSRPPSVLANPIAHAGPVAAKATAVAVLGRYARALVCPVDLAPDHSYGQITTDHAFASPFFWVGVAAVAAVGLLLWRFRRSIPARTALLILSLGLLPVSNLLFPIGTVMALRLLYFPSAGFALLLALALESGVKSLTRSRAPSRIARARIVSTACLAPILVGYGMLTVSALAPWADDLALFSAAQRTAPRSALIHYNLGTALLDRRAYDRAEQEFRKTVAIYPAYPGALSNLGLALIEQDRPDAALPVLRRALAVDPASREARTNLATACTRSGLRAYGRGDRARAKARFVEAAALGVPAPEAYFNLARLYRDDGQATDALDALERAAAEAGRDPRLLGRIGHEMLALGRKDLALPVLLHALEQPPPDTATQTALGMDLLAVGRTTEALALLQSVARARPTDPHALNNLAWGLVTAGQNLDRALALARDAVRRAPGSPAAWDTLASVHDALGQCPQALEAARRALSVRASAAAQGPPERSVARSRAIVARGCP